MPFDLFPAQHLALLFDREACTHAGDITDQVLWLPTTTQLEQWILAALSYSLVEEQRGKMIEISLNCVSTDEIRDLNLRYRSKDNATNVLSFPADMPLLPANDNTSTPTLLLGDIVVCPQVLETEAESQSKLIDHHWAHMLIHSVLHLNGLDHEGVLAADAMESLEIQILSSLGIANPYLAASAKES